MADTRRRVKVYTLNEERQWDDRGTGHVSSGFVDRLKGMTLIVRAEHDGSLLLESKILLDTAYQKQQETLIVWSEGENTDLALSFQEKAGCDEIWEKICEVQGKDPSVYITQDIADDDDDIGGDRLDDSTDSLQQSASPYVLPPCELGQLEEIAELFTSSLSSLVRREQLARGIEESDYIQKLLTLFHTCEDLENIEGLHRLYEIMRSIFLLNRSSLFDVMLQESHIIDVVGCLEYDPSLSAPQKHRDYLLQEVNFKEVLPIENDDLKRKIHLTFRLQYIQDVVLPTPSVFEENMLSTLSSLIFFNKVEIVNLVRGDESFLSSVFEQLRDETTDDKRRQDLAGFIRELCSLSQTLQPTSRDDFFRQLGDLGVLQAIEVLLSGDDLQSHRVAIDVFAHVVEHSPSMVRDFARKETNEGDGDDDLFLLNLVIEQIIYDPDPELGRAIQLIGLLRVLLDPESMLANKNEKTEFLAFYYRNCMHVLMAPLLANTADEKRPGKDDYRTAHLLSLILDLLTFSVEHHAYNIKNYVLNKDLLRRVLVLLNSKHSFLPLSALRFMRKIVGRPDEFYRRYLIKGDLFAPVVEKLFQCGKRYNLLNSAILEIFEYIRSEDIKILVSHVVEQHYKQLESINYTTIFQGLKRCYDQEQNRSVIKASHGNHRFRRDDREPEEEEELWFEKDDELDVADAFDAPKINIDSVLGENKADEKKPDPLPSNGVHEDPPASNVTVKNGLVGLVDYPDDDSEDDDAADKEPAVKDDVTKESVTIERCGGEIDASEEPALKKPKLLQVTDD